MPFTQQQVRKLKASVRQGHVRSREIEGKTLHYLEGWHVVSEANRIFGFDAWDRETVSSECVWRTQVEGQYAAAYLTRVRIRVRAGEGIIVREGLGSGEAIAPSPGAAHERASKAAETDATKRALSTFGNSFGLSLYRDKSEPPRHARVPVQQVGTAAQRVVREVAKTVRAGERIAGPSSRPHPFIREPRANSPEHVTKPNPDPVLESTTQSPSERVSPIKPEQQSEATTAVAYLPVHLPPGAVPQPIDKSVLALSEPKRRRDREHLRFVARQPCLVCGRTPSQAHHLRIAQPRALGRKVSDEYTVPLCALHHHDLHMKGTETEWWWGHNIEPLPIAERLWAQHVRGEQIRREAQMSDQSNDESPPG